jgi:hypothetical protein
MTTASVIIAVAAVVVIGDGGGGGIEGGDGDTDVLKKKGTMRRLRGEGMGGYEMKCDLRSVGGVDDALSLRSPSELRW